MSNKSFTKKQNRNYIDASKKAQSEKTDTKSERGFWATDFSQRTPSETYKQEEAIAKNTLANSSRGKKLEEIDQAMGRSVSDKDLYSLKIDIYDISLKIKTNEFKNNKKMKGILQLLLIRLENMTRKNNPIIISSPPVSSIDFSNVDSRKYQPGDFVQIKKQHIYNIVKKDTNDTYTVKDCITGEETLEEKKNVTYPEPKLTNLQEQVFGNIKKSKLDSMKNDIQSLKDCSNLGEVNSLSIKSSLGRAYMLFKYTDLYIRKQSLESVINDNDEIHKGFVVTVFKMYFKLFYEDVISVSDMIIELNYLLDNWNDFDEDKEGFRNEAQNMVNRCIGYFQGILGEQRYNRLFLEELFGKLSGFIPPLKRKKFILDPFQKEVCNAITNKESFILVAPTSSGKSVLSTYALHNSGDDLVIIVVPDDSDVLAWQFAAKIEAEMEEVGKGTYVPILTGNYKSVLTAYTEKNDKKYKKLENEIETKKKNDNEMNIFEKIKSSRAIVGTASEILQILPEIEIKAERNIGYVIFDEIHTIDITEGKDMEHISKIVGKMNIQRKKENKSDIPFMGLSATISNPEFLQDWYQSIGWEKVGVIRCSQRFFNLQLHTTNSDGDIIKINPLSMVSFSDLLYDENGKSPILSREIDFTAVDVWELWEKINNSFMPNDDIEWSPYNKFSFILEQNLNENINVPKVMFELEDVKIYGEELIKVLVNYANSDDTKNTAEQLITSLEPPHIDTHENLNLFELFKKLMHDNKIPVIAFMVNPSSCLRLVKSLYRDLRNKESDKNDTDVSDKLSMSEASHTKETRRAKKDAEKQEAEEKKKKDAEKAKKSNAKFCKEQEKGSGGPKNQQRKKWKDTKDKGIDFEYHKPIAKNTFFGTRDESEAKDFDDKFRSIVNDFNSAKIYESNNNEIFWLIDLLQFGIGVYVKGLAGTYLRKVQSLALQKKLKIVFSDKSLMFGVSMPFRTALIFRDFYDQSRMPIDPMMFQQMSGRAGRRGEDVEGNIIVSGFSWKDIKALCVKDIPVLKGYKNNYLYTTSSCSYISDGKYGHSVLDTNFLNTEIDENKEKFFEISRKANDIKPVDANLLKYHRMMWRGRDTQDSIVLPFIINPMIQYFRQSKPEDEQHQVEIAYFLCHFIHTRKSNEDNSLTKVNRTFKVKDVIKSVYQDLEKNGIYIDDSHIDSRIFNTVGGNKIPLYTDDITEIARFKEEFLKFSKKVIDIQHYCFYTAEPLLYCEMKQDFTRSRLENIKKVSTLLGKLVTRLWWEYQLDPMTLLDEDTVSKNTVIPVNREKNNLNECESQNIIELGNSNFFKDNVIIGLGYSNFFKDNGIKSTEIIGDGNCMFRAISLAEYGTEDKHLELRKVAIEYIQNNESFFNAFITSEKESFDDYVTRLKQNGEWGGEHEISAMKEILGRPIYVYSNKFKTVTGLNQNLNGDNLTGDVILLHYFDGIDTKNFEKAAHYELFVGDITLETIENLKEYNKSNGLNTTDVLSVSSEEDTSSDSKSKEEGKKSISKKSDNKDSTEDLSVSTESKEYKTGKNKKSKSKDKGKKFKSKKFSESTK